tara:strand:- start:1013 stop:2410 length:1398 start_codon:yes stop_codon:yes gene_type:complete
MPIDEQTLESFLSGNLSVLDEIIGTDASELKNILNSATISGMKSSDILNQVTAASSASTQRAIINTRLNTYSRVATNTMMKDAPANTKYVYIGPVDDRTRDECLDMASAGALTENEIITRFGEAPLVDGGGFNCRHKWEIASAFSDQFNKSDKAGNLIQDKKEAQAFRQAKGKYRPKPKPYDKNALYQAGKHRNIPDSKSWIKSNVADKVTLSNLKDLNLSNELTDTLNNLFTTYKIKKLTRGVTGKARGQAMASANGSVLNISKSALSRKALDKYYIANVKNYNKGVKEVIDGWKSKLKEFESLGAYKYGREIKWYRKNIRIWENKLQNQKDFGFKRFVYSVEGRELTSIITHELGHTIHDQYSGFINRSLIKSKGIDATKWNNEWKDIYRITTAKKGVEVRLLNGQKALGTAEVGLISEYAAANPFELFAESFSMYATGAANELPTIIKDYLDRYLSTIKEAM